MQTFLPYEGFRDSAQSLDMKRLGKQRVEGYQILKTLLGESNGWQNHPAVKMWRGSEFSLWNYTNIVCSVWVARGYNDSVQEKLEGMLSDIPEGKVPDWLGNETFHRSHRANLVSKDPEFYVPKFGKLEWEPYVWPSNS